MSEREHPRIDIRQYAIRARDLTVQDFDLANEPALADTLAELNKINLFRLKVVARGAEIGLGPRFEAYAIAGSSFDIVVSALHMVRQRRAIEAAALLRVAVEATCTAIHIFCDRKAYADYRAGDYKSTRSVSYGKRVIPVVGELWGALSQFGVHVNPVTFGVRWEPSVDEGAVGRIESFYGIRPPLTDTYDRVSLVLIALGALVVLKAHELIVLEDEPKLPGWSRLVGTDTGYLHHTDEAIEKYRHELGAYVQADVS